MDLETFLLVTYFVSSALICQFSLFVIRKYHISKPLGMQTLLGEVIIIMTKMFSFTHIIKFVSHSIYELFPGTTFPKGVSVVWVLVEFASSHMFTQSLFVVVVIKYLSIFHGTFLALFDEEKLLRKVKIALVISPLLFDALEYSCLSNMEYMVTYQHKYLGYKDLGAQEEKSTKPIFYVTVMLALVMYFRIEKDVPEGGIFARMLKKLTALKSCCNGENQEEHITIGYNIRVIRLLTISLLAGTFLSVYNLIYGLSEIVTMLSYITISNIIIPLIFVCKHDDMTKIAVKLLKSFVLEPKCVSCC